MSDSREDGMQAQSRATGDGRWRFSGAGAQRAGAGLMIAAAAALLAELAVERHGYFQVERLFGFYAGAGLAAALVVVLAGLILRPVLSRSEDHYDR